MTSAEAATPDYDEARLREETDLPAIVENVQRNVRVFGIADIYTPEVVTAILKNAL